MIIERDIFKTYLAAVKGSVGTGMFRHFYARFDGEERDTMEDGWKSCAFYVSAVLTIFGVLDKPHSTVSSLIEAMQIAGWQQVNDKPEPGDVLVWEDMKPTIYDPPTPHTGFYLGDDKAVSNSWTSRAPVEHDWLFRDYTARKVTGVYRGKHLMPINIKTVEE